MTSSNDKNAPEITQDNENRHPNAKSHDEESDEMIIDYAVEALLALSYLKNPYPETIVDALHPTHGRLVTPTSPSDSEKAHAMENPTSHCRVVATVGSAKDDSKSINTPTMTSNEKRWEKNFLRFKAFLQVHGHTKIPKADAALFNWWQNQRYHFRRKALSQDRVNALNELGVDWSTATKPFSRLKTAPATYCTAFALIAKSSNVHDQTWVKHFLRLREYHRIHGHTKVPKTEGVLYTWWKNQRYQYHCKTLSQERINCLREFGSTWFTKHSSGAHNDVRVTMKALSPQEPPSQSSKAASGKKPDAKKSVPCHTIATCSDSWKDRQWYRNYSALKAFQKRWGHTYAPSDCQVDCVHLGNWVRNQRYAFRLKKISQERIGLLNAIDFDWTSHVGIVKTQQKGRSATPTSNTIKHKDTSVQRSLPSDSCAIETQGIPIQAPSRTHGPAGPVREPGPIRQLGRVDAVMVSHNGFTSNGSIVEYDTNDLDEQNSIVASTVWFPARPKCD